MTMMVTIMIAVAMTMTDDDGPCCWTIVYHHIHCCFCCSVYIILIYYMGSHIYIYVNNILDSDYVFIYCSPIGHRCVYNYL